jgi:hypothetical protein
MATIAASCHVFLVAFFSYLRNIGIGTLKRTLLGLPGGLGGITSGTLVRSRYSTAPA